MALHNPAQNIINFFQKGKAGLVPKQVQVTNKQGKTYMTTRWVKVGEEDGEQFQPVGEDLSPEVGGMKITKYSEKAVLITGDTYVNKDDLRAVKKEIGVGTWNRKLEGWVFPIKFIDTILGILTSKQREKGNDDKADAIVNQKNESLKTGDTVTVNGEEGKVTEGVSDSEGTKYNVTMGDGTNLEGVNEKAIDKPAETDDKKISEALNSTQPENRAKVAKKIYGIKSIENIHTYTLEDYMKLHGLSDEDIQGAINMLTPSKNPKKRTGGSGKRSSNSKEAKEGQALSKRQLALKLIRKHRMAVEAAVSAGETVSDSVLKYYPDLSKKQSEKESNKEMDELDDFVNEQTKKVDEEKESVGGSKEPMSEETKRKISEALKGRGIPKIDELHAKIASLRVELDSSTIRYNKHKKEESSLDEQIRTLSTKWGDDSQEAIDKRELRSKLVSKRDGVMALKNAFRGSSITEEIENIEAKISCLENGGDLITVSDKVGTDHVEVPDYTNISVQNIEFDADTILTTPRPSYIPNIHIKTFERMGYMPDVAKIGDNRYLISLKTYKEQMTSQFSISTNKKDYDPTQGYAVLTLDQLALTQEYFIEKQKAHNKVKAAEDNKSQKEYWFRLSEDRRKRSLDRVTHRDIPAKLKKKFTPEVWNAMSWDQKEEHYQHIKTYGVKRVTSVWNNKKKKDFMPTSFHVMHERFVDPTHKRYKSKNGIKTELNRTEGASGQHYGHQAVFDDWRNIKKMFAWKLSDLKIERENISDMRKKALETSYGESGTDDTILDSHGIKTKRQNGDIISGDQIDQIKLHWESIQEVFAPLKEMAKSDNLKISHSGEKLMFAAKAVGMYVPSMMTIGVSQKYGDDQFSFTFAHEVAHYMDNKLGGSNGGRFASGDYESSAGKLASALREGMNGVNSANDYYASSHECFARSMEQYFAIETKGTGTTKRDDTYFEMPYYANESLYNSKIKPLVEAFLQENGSFFKSFLNEFAILGV